jgi:glycine oxidase
MQSLELFPEFVSELETASGKRVDHRRDGVLLVGITRDDVEHLRFRYDYQKSLGLEVEWLSGDEARGREPHLSPRISAGVWCPGDEQVDNRLMMLALREAFSRAGGHYTEGSCVSSVVVEGGRVQGVVADGERLEADAVVLAAGAWSPHIEGLPKDCQPPVRPVKGQILRLRMTDQVALKTIVWYSRHESSCAIYMAPKSSGELVLGATSEEMGYDTQPTAGGVLELLRGAWEAVPGVYDLPVTETKVGLRPGSRDDAPVLGPTSVEGLVMATGHFRKGILLSAITSLAIAEWFETGNVPTAIQGFGIDRFQN